MHAAGLVELDDYFADLSGVGSDQNEQLLFEVWVLNVAVGLRQHFQVILEPLQEQVYLQIKLFLDLVG